MSANDYGWGLFRKGMKRRAREVRRMRIMTCLAVFFLAFTLLLQDNIGALRMELNYRNYGRWFACASDGFFSKYQFLEESGTATVGSSIYLIHPKVSAADGSFENDLAPVETVGEDGKVSTVKPEVTDENGEFLPPAQEIVVENFGRSRFVEGHIGVLSEGFADNNGIRLYEGRFPEADDEIVLDLPTLHILGLSYELDQEVSFYISMKEPILPDYLHMVNGERVYEAEDLYLPLKLVTFRLVGTLQRYTARWSCGSEMPSAIITQEAFDSLGSYRTELKFYDLAEGLDEEKTWEFASSQFAAFSEKEQTWLLIPSHIDTNKNPVEIHKWNTEAYENPLWGSGTLYRYITLLLAVMSSCILAYLMASYLTKRRVFFTRMREIGASSFEVVKLAAYECGASTLPFAAVSAALAYGAAAGAALILKNVLDIKPFLVLSLRTMLTMAGCVLLVWAVSLAAAIILFTGRRPTQKKKQLSRGAEKALSRRAARKHGRAYLGLSESLIRERRIHAVKTFLIRAVTLLVCGLILYSFLITADAYYSYEKILNGGADFYGTYSQNLFNEDFACRADIEPKYVTRRLMIDYEDTVMSTTTFWQTSKTLSRDFIADVEQLSGIKRFEYATYDNTHPLEWEGKDGDPFVDYCIDTALHGGDLNTRVKLRFDGKRIDDMRNCMDSTFYRFLCFSETKELWRGAGKYLDKSTADYNAFVEGKQIIMVVDTELYTVLKGSFEWRDETLASLAETGENKWEELGHSFEPGDVITIKSADKKNGIDTEAVIAGIMPASEYTKLAFGSGDRLGSRVTWVDEQNYGVFMAVGSSALAERVMVNDGGKFGFNSFGIKFSSIAKSENAMKSLSALCVRYGATYTDLTEDISEIRSDFYDTLLTYGFFCTVLIVLYFFVMGCAAREDCSALAPKVKALRRTGTSTPALKLQKSFDAAKQSLWVMGALPVCALLQGLGSMKYHAPEDHKLTTVLFAFAKSIIDSVKYTVDTILPVLLCLAFLLAAVLWFLNRRLVLKGELPERKSKFHLLRRTK